MWKGSDDLKVEVTKLKNSKIKNKIVAILVSDNGGIRFAELLAQVSGISVEIYNISESNNCDLINATIRDLNNDPDVALVINTTRNTVDIFIHESKRCFYTLKNIKSDKNNSINPFVLEQKMQLIEVDKIIRKLNSLE